MRNKLTLLIAVFILGIGFVIAQAPEAINYQAVARNLSGVPLVNQGISVRYEIRQGSSTGTAVYVEDHSLTTNQFGLFTAEIGNGTPFSGTFAGINWGSGSYYLYVEVDGNPMGATQLLSVPYALYSKESANGPAGAPGKNSLALSTNYSGALCPNGGTQVDVGLDDNDDGTLQTLEIDFTYYICNGVDGTNGVNGTNGTDGVDGNDGVGIVSTVDNGDGTFTINYSDATSFTTSDLTGPAGTNGTNGTTYYPGNGITFNNDTIINAGDNDNDSNNELISTTTLNGTIIEITENGTLHTIDLSGVINTNDTSAINELQTISLNATSDTIFLSNGGGYVALPATSGDNWGSQVVITDATLSGDGTSSNPLSGFDGDYTSLTNQPIIPTNTSDLTNDSGFITSPNDADSDPTNEIELPATATTNQVLTWNGSAWVAQNPGSGADNWGSQVVITDGVTITGTGVVGDTLVGFDGDYTSLTNQPTIPANTSDLTNDSGFITSPNDADSDPTNEIELPATASTNDVLIWNGSAWVAGTAAPDGDGNSTNEIQNLSVSGNNLNISGGTGTTISSNGPTTGDMLYWDGANWTAQPVASININDADSDPTNEIELPATAGTGDILYYNGVSWVANPTPADSDNQNLSNSPSGSDVTVNITGGTGTTFSINDGDYEPTNEIQTLSFTSPNLSISSGNSVDLSGLTNDGDWTQGTGIIYNTSDSVGIGTNAPEALLHVTRYDMPQFKIGNDNQPAYEWSFDVDPVANMTIRNEGNGIPMDFMYLNSSNNRIGIGTNNPTARLHHDGSLRLDNLSGTAPAVGAVLTSMDAQGNAEWQPLPSSPSTYWNPSGSDIYNNNAGNVGIGITPSHKLDISGDVNLNGVYRIDGTVFLDNKNLSTLVGNTLNTGLAGNYNTFVGEGAGQNTAAATRNTFMGRYAGNANTTGSDNTLIGAQAGYNASNASNNTIIGTYAGSQISTGSDNTIIGQNAGTAIMTGDANTLLGYNANTGGAALVNSTAIGANSVVSSNNSLVLGNNANVGIGISAPTEKLHVMNGTIRVDNGSNVLDFSQIAGQSLIRASNQLAVDANGGGTVFTIDDGNADFFVQLSIQDGSQGLNRVLTSDALGYATWTDLASISSGSAAWTKSGGNVYLSTTTDNVGIGTSTPSYKIHGEDNIGRRTAYFFNSTNAANIAFNEIMGVYGGAHGTGASDKIGGYFESSNGSGVNYGVYGYAMGGSQSWAGYFDAGDVFIQNKLGINGTPPASSKLYVVGNGNGSTINASDNSITNGSLLYLSSTSTTGTANNSSHMIFINRSGANTNSTHTAYGIRSSVTNSGTSSINMAGYFSASNAAANWAGYFANGNIYIKDNVGLGTVSPAAKLNIYDNVATGGSMLLRIDDNSGNDILHFDDNAQLVMGTDAGSLVFSADLGTNSPEIYMFSSGTSNGDRTILAHSPTYPTWGLQYQDATDKFNFISGGTPVLTVDLAGQQVGIGTDTPGTSLEVNGAVTYTPQTFAAGSSTFTLNVGNTSYMRVTTTLGGATMSGISNGLKPGQFLIIENVGGYLLTIQDGGANLYIAGNALLYSNDTITLIWTGTRWLELSRSDN